jgi:hypothetical protein
MLVGRIISMTMKARLFGIFIFIYIKSSFFFFFFFFDMSTQEGDEGFELIISTS